MSLPAARLNLRPGCFDQDVVVITGAGRGIGREMARAFACWGARVVIAEISDQGADVEREIRAAGGQALYVRTDVSDVDSVAALAQATHGAFGPASVLINNAIVSPVAPVLEMDVATWDRVLAVNLRGTFLTCKAFLPDMLAQNRGTILNLVSTDAMPGISAYIASKQGIMGFSGSLAAEVGQGGVRVVAFGPGMVDTPGIRSVAESGLPEQLGFSREQFLGMSLHPAFDGLMPAGYAAAAAVYLVAEAADDYHGESVDGYTLLERSGLIQATSVPAGMVAEAAPPARESCSLATTLALCRELEDVLRTTEEEFNQFPLFARPMARSGFKRKAGQSVQDWRRMLDRFGQLTGQAAAGQPQQAAQFAAERSLMAVRLEQLVSYFEAVPAETARFTRDQELLRNVTQVMADRVALVQQLRDALNA
ncbi:MAG: SDR family oxidoreductase [Caldilineales bacterium]